MKVEIVYYDPRRRGMMSNVMVEMNGLEDWRVQAMVHKLRREGKVIKDVKKITEPVKEKKEESSSASSSGWASSRYVDNSSSFSGSSSSGGNDYSGGGGDFSGGGSSGDW